MTVDLVIGDLKDEAQDPGDEPDAKQPKQSRLGIRLEDLDAALRGRLDLPERISGAVITEVQPGPPAAKAGLRPGDIIHEVNGRTVVTAEDATAAVRGADGSVVLRVWSQGASRCRDRRWEVVAAKKRRCVPSGCVGAGSRRGDDHRRRDPRGSENHRAIVCDQRTMSSLRYQAMDRAMMAGCLIYKMHHP